MRTDIRYVSEPSLISAHFDLTKTALSHNLGSAAFDFDPGPFPPAASGP
jgi:hypothetical protein